MRLALEQIHHSDLAAIRCSSTVNWLPLLDSNQPHSRLTAEHHHLDSLEGMISMDAPRGFEPRFPDSESGVLPYRRWGNILWSWRLVTIQLY
jgi:hypothetical protein